MALSRQEASIGAPSLGAAGGLMHRQRPIAIAGRLVWATIGLFLATLMMVAGIGAQSFQGGIRGSVQDTAGGVIPGASLTLEDANTGTVRRTSSNETGEYSFANVSPGTYSILAELEGFASSRHEGLTVGISVSLVEDITLELGGLDQTLTVSSAAPMIENGSASVASMIDRKQIESLPSPGRNVFILAVTTPNVVHTGNPVWVKQSDQTNSSLLSLGGGPLRGNNYTIDGVSMTDLRNRSVIIPIFEAVEELKIQTNTYDAEMGRTGGGVFNTIHRRGTNEWAGSAHYQFRPGQLDTVWRRLAYFQQRDIDRGLIGRDDLGSAPYNLAGGAFGGPIRRGRTFFWVASEGYSDDAIGNTTITLPTPAEATGDFSESGATIYDPASLDSGGARSPLPNNRLPPERLDPTGTALAGLLSSLGPGGRISTSGIQTVRAIQTTGNLSHSAGEKWTFSGTFLHYQSREPLFGHYQDLLNSDTRPAFSIGASTLGRRVEALALNASTVLTASSVLTMRYGQTYFDDSWSSPNFSEQDLRQQIGIQGSFLDKIYAQEGYLGQFPAISVTDYGNGGQTHGARTNDDVNWTSREASGSYSVLVGNHTLKLGAQWRRLGLHSASFGNGFSMDFAKRFTQGPDPLRPVTGSGNALAELLLGIPNGGNATLATPADFFVDYFGGFLQDDWRVSPGLVLNLGLRIEHESGLREHGSDFAVGWERGKAFPAQVGTAADLEQSLPGFPLKGGLMYAGVDGNPDHQWNPPAVKLGPRVGFAYSLDSATVVRGGLAVFWAPYAIPRDTGASYTGTYGFTAVTNLPASVDGIVPPVATASNPFPHGILDPTGNASGRFQNIGGDVYFNDQHRDSPYITKWSLDIQREIKKDLAVKVGYVGSRGSDLPIGGTLDSVININQLADPYLELGDRLNDRRENPFRGDARFGEFAGEALLPLGQLLRPFPHFRNVYARHVTAGKSAYHSLRAELERRFGRSWGARVNYTRTIHHDNVYEDNTLGESLTSQIYNTPDACASGKCPVLESDYSPSRLHVPHQANINLNYQTKARGRIFGGWGLSISGTLRSGFPLVITQNENPLQAYGFGHQRPESVRVSAAEDPGRDPERYLRADSIVPTEGLRIGGGPHTTNEARTPSLFNWDTSAEKNIRLSENTRITLRFEFINVLNNVNWRGPRTVFGSDDFGSIPGTRGFPRTFQLMAKLAF